MDLRPGLFLPHFSLAMDGVGKSCSLWISGYFIMSRMDHWSVVAMVSVPAMTRSSMDAIKLSSWKRLSFLFFSLKSTRGKKSHKTISLSIQQAQEMLHNLQHSWLWSCVCELSDKMDLILNAQRWGSTEGRFGGEFWLTPISPGSRLKPRAVQRLSLAGLERAWSVPWTEADSIPPLRDSSCPKPGLTPQQCSNSPFRPFLPRL